MNFYKWVFVQHSNIVSRFQNIAIFYCANTTVLHMPDRKFSEGVVRLTCVAKWVAAWKKLKTTDLNEDQKCICGLWKRFATPNVSGKSCGVGLHGLRFQLTLFQGGQYYYQSDRKVFEVSEIDEIADKLWFHRLLEIFTVFKQEMLTFFVINLQKHHEAIYLLRMIWTKKWK